MKKTLKILSTILAIVLVFGTVSVGMSAYADDSDYIGAYDFEITNPYKDIDWGNVTAYKAITHFHTVRSDADTEVDDMILHYYDLGYDAACLTDHGTVNYGWDHAQTRLTWFDYQYFVHGEADELSSEEYEGVITGSRARSINNGKGMMEIPLGIEINGASTIKCHINGYFADACHGDLNMDADWPRDAVVENFNAGGFTHINHVGEWTGGNDDPEVYDSSWVSDFASIYQNYGACRGGRNTTAQNEWNNAHGMAGCIGMELVNTTDNRTHKDRRYVYDEILKILAPQGINVFGFCEDDAHEFEDCDRNAQYFLINNTKTADVTITKAELAASDRSGDDDTSDYNNSSTDPMDVAQNCYRDAMYYGEFYCCSQNSKNSYELGDGFYASGDYPSVSNISIDSSKNQIIITYKDATKLRVVADGEIIETHRTDADTQTVAIDLNRNEGKINSYVRIYLTGAGGITYLQPFLVKKTASDTSSVQFVTPSTDTNIVVKDSNGSVVSDSLKYQNNYYILPAGNYTYTASRRGYVTKENVPFTVTQEQYDNDEQIKINVTLDELTDVTWAYFYAPETIYVNPSNNTTFAKYIDRENAINGALHTDPQTTGNIYFHRDGASNMELSWTAVDGAASIYSMNVGATTAAGDTLATSIISGSLSQPLSNEEYCYIKWTLTYDYNGFRYTAYQYSYVYKPLTDTNSVVAAGGIAKTNHTFPGWPHTTMAIQATVYVGGLHKLESNYTTGYLFNPYIYTNFSSVSLDIDDYANAKVSGAGYKYETDISDGAGSSDVRSDNTDGAYIYADRSRINNWSQIPYFVMGIDLQGTTELCGDDDDDTAQCVRFAFDQSHTTLETRDASYDYLLDIEFGSGNSSYYKRMDYNLDDGNNYDYEASALSAQGLDGIGNGRYYEANNEVAGRKFTKALPSEDTQESTVDVSAYILGSKSGRTDQAHLGVHITLVNTNKSSLRTEFNNTVKGCFQEEWFQSVEEWNTYQNVISEAGKVLGNPAAEIAEIEEMTEKLQDAVDNFTLKSGTKSVVHYWKTSDGEGLIYEEPDTSYVYADDLAASSMEITGYTYANEYTLTVENSLKYTYANGYKTDAVTGVSTASTEDTFDNAFAEKSSYVWKFYYTPNQYNVTYNSNGAAALTSSDYSATASFGQNYTVSSTIPSKSGYTFDGWYLDTTQKTYSAGATFKWNYAGDGEFTAQWSAKVYNVTYDVNGGNTLSVATRYKTVVYGDTYPICPTVPVKTGYNFEGWALNGNTDNLYTAGSQVYWKFASDGTFVAQWKIADYTVDFDAVKPDAYVTSDTITVHYEMPYGTLPEPTRTGYTSQWYSDPNYPSNALVTADTTVKIAGDHTLFAKYTPIEYNISYELNGGSVSVANPTKYTIESGDITLNNPVRTGYVFTGWSGSDISSTAYEKTHVIESGSMGDKSFVAHWDLEGYNIYYNLDGGINDSRNKTSYKSTDTVTIYEPTKFGYRFLGWTGSNGDLAESSVVISAGSTGDKTYNADWELVNYTITYEYDGATTVPSNPISYTVNTETFTLTEPLKTGYVFNGWDSNITELTGASVTIAKGDVSGNLTFTALWREAAAHKITYVLNGGHAEGSNPSSYKYPSTITINKPVRDGYSFKNWTKQVGTGALQTLADGENAKILATDNGPVTLTAYWTKKDYTISYNLAGGFIAANATNPTSYNIESSNITLVNPIKPGYTFNGWTGTGLTKATTNVEIPTGTYGNRSYTAVWSAITYKVTYDFNGGSDTGLIKSYKTTTTATIGAPVRTGYTFAGWNIKYTDFTWTEGTITSGKFVTSTGKYYSSPISLKSGLTYTISSAASGLKFCVYGTDGSFITATTASSYTATADCVAYIITGSTTLDNIRSTTVTLASGTDNTLDSYSITQGSMGDLNFTANWDDVTYTIGYELDGGEIPGGLSNPTSYTYNSATIRLYNPEKTGYDFLGWNYNGVVSTSVTIPKNSTGDRTYVATWNIASYSITYNGLDGANDPGNRTSYTIDDTFTLTRPTKSYYSFDGWVGTGLTESTYDVTVAKNSTGDRTYTATWTPDTYGITYELNGGTNSSSNKNSYTIETETFSLYAPTKTGCTFTGWSGTGIEGTSTSVTIPKGSNGNRTYTASWSTNVYFISYDLAGGTETTNPTTYTANDTVSLAQPTRSGYTFTGWTETGSETLVKDVTIPQGSTGDKNYLAHWSVNTYTITYTLNGGQLSDSAKKSYTVETATFTLETPTREGYRFAGWTGTDLTSASTSVTISKGSVGTRAYTATWVEDSFTITYTNVDYSDVTFETDNRTSYTAITPTFTLINPSRTGYTFTGWTGTGISGTGISTTVTIPKGSTGDRTYTANWSVAEYTITYHLDGGAEVLPNPTTYTYFSAPITLNNPTKSGFVFAGWVKDGSSEVLTTATINNHSTGNLVFTATWSAGDYTITLDANGGTLPSGQASTINYTYTTPTFTINNPTKSGFTFAGWSGTGITGTKQTLQIPINSIGDRTYTANWSSAANIITYDLAGGSIKAGTNPESYETNSGTITIINPTRVGYKFNGWSYSASNVSVNSFNKAAKIDTTTGGSIAFTATWTPISYNITYNLNGGSISSNKTSYTVEEAFTIPVPTRTGYSFAGWSGTGLSYKTVNVTVNAGTTGNRTYTANWSEETYTITYNYNGGSVDNSNPVNYTVLSDSFTLNNPTKTGFTFTGWSGTGITDSQSVVTVSTGSTGNRTYTANFSAIVYSITYVDTEGSSFDSSTSKKTYTAEDGDISIPNITKAGYTFLGWQGEGEINPQTNLIIKSGSSGDKLLTAKWSIIKYTITYVLNDGIVNGENPETYTVESPNITLINPTKTGFTFRGWSTTASGTPSLTTAIAHNSTGNKTFYALWSTRTYTITYEGCDFVGMSYTPVKTTYTAEDDDFTLNNPVRTGYDFNGWTDETTGLTSKVVTIASGSSGNKKFTANWLLNEYTINVNYAGGSSTKSVPVTYTVESDTIKLPIPKKEGFVFVGWSGTGIASGSTSTNVEITHGSTGSREYTAVWTDRTDVNHKIYFYGYNDTLLKLSNGLYYEEVPIGQPIPDPIDDIEDTVGYKLTGWDIDLTDSKYVNLNDDIEVHATWAPCDTEYTVIVNGSMSYTKQCGQYDKITISTESESKTTGAEFSHWVAVKTDAQGTEISREIVSYYQNYSFYVHSDVYLIAVYGSSSSVKASSRVSYVEEYDPSYDWFTVYTERNVATNYTLIQHGAIFTDNATIGSKNTNAFTATTSQHETYVNNSSFVIGTSGVKKGVSSVDGLTGMWTLSIKNPYTYYGNTIYIRSFVVVADQSGVTTTIYGKVVTYDNTASK